MRFALAIAASAVLVLSAPFIGQLRAFIQDTFPGQYTRIIAGSVVGSVAVAIVVALVRIRERRARRYGVIAAALVLGVGYASLSTSGDPAVDAVERFHFVEYGLIALLFYRAFHPTTQKTRGGGPGFHPTTQKTRGGGPGFQHAGDASALVLPLLAGLLVGICEEWLQWFVPSRVGELRDVVLNLWAVGCGLLFGLGIDPPPQLRLRPTPASWRRIRYMTAVVLVALGVFLDSVHLGYRIDDPATGAFRSIYSAGELTELARERAERWRAHPPLTWSRLSREDQYMTEGVSHVRRRNICWDQDVSCTWHENLILERHFAPVLDTPSYISPEGHRWKPEQRADAASRATSAPYVSEADKDSPIFTWPKPLVFGAIGLALALLLWPRRRAQADAAPI